MVSAPCRTQSECDPDQVVPLRLAALKLSLGLLAVGRLTAEGQDSAAAVRAPGPAALRLDLNLPSFQLDVYEGGVRSRRYRVAVGMRGFRTPRGTFEITSVEWNPWWNPPDQPWAKKEKITPPGGSNPMGRVKLNFRPLYFFHGTPLETSLGRAASHGCIRMANADAISLARLVHSVGTPSVATTLLDSLVADTAHTQLFQLDSPVPVEIRYELAEVSADTLVLYRDVYSLDRRSEVQRALDALVRHGIALEQVDAKRLSRRLRSTSQRPVKINLEALLIEAPPH